jgi:hypothetical protein
VLFNVDVLRLAKQVFNLYFLLLRRLRLVLVLLLVLILVAIVVDVGGSLGVLAHATSATGGVV